MSGSNYSNLQPFVRRLLSHSRLSISDQQAILGLPTHTEEVVAQRDFVRCGERLDHACFIVGGLVGRFSQTVEGARQITALHIAGNMADLHSVMLPNATSGLQALTTTTILHVPHAALRGVAKTHEAIAEAFWREGMIDAAILSQWVVNVGRRTARARIAHLLCEMAVRYGAAVAPHGSFQFAATQNHLADATALTPVHVNRTLKALRDDGIAVVRFKTVEILDWAALQKEGEFDPSYLGPDTFAANRDVPDFPDVFTREAPGSTAGL